MLRRVHVLRTIVTAARRLRATVRSAAVVAVALVQVPVFILRNQAIFQNELVYPFWIWSFGHTTLGIDFASRLYYPARISLVFVPHPRSNSFVPLCFDHNVDVFFYRPSLDDRGLGGAAQFAILRFWLLLLSGLTGRFTVVDRTAVYKAVSVAEDRLLASDREGRRLVPTPDMTGYMRLLREGVGRRPALPAELTERCRRRIEERHPSFFARPFVTFALREKGRNEPFDSAARCCGPQENYRPAVRFLTENGYHVVGAAETRHEIFTDLPGYFGLDDVDLPRELADIFVLTTCALLVGQLSGPISPLANTTGVPCVVPDAMPHRLGTFAPDDILVFKTLRVAATGRPLSLVEIYVDRPELAYGVGLAESGVLIEPSTPEEILAGVEEVVARVEGRLQLTQEDEALIERFREIVPAQMLLSYLGNRPSLSALRAVRSELLGGPPPLGRSSRA